MGGIVGDPNPIDTAPASVVTVDDVMIEEFEGTAVVAMTDQVIGGDFFVRQSELDAVAGVTVGVDKWMMAIEEALANAIYHRNYELLDPIEVRILPLALEIISFNGVDPSLKQSDFDKGIVRARRDRNRRIGEFLKDLKLTEGKLS